ncbi:SH3 domain-containing protein [Entamoeba marina]
MESLNRTFFSLKSMLGVSHKPVDTEVENSKKKLQSMSAEYKKITKTVEDLPKLFSSLINQHIVIFNATRSIVQMSTNNEVIINNATLATEIFQKQQMSCAEYQKHIKNQIMIPLTTYGEQFNELTKRFTTLQKRKEDLDFYEEKLTEITTKPANKQKGLADAQTNFSYAQDKFVWLKLELLEDVDKLCTNCETVGLPLIRELLSSFDKFISNLSTGWQDVPNMMKELPTDNLPFNYVVKPFCDSYEKEQNVNDRRSQNFLQKSAQQQTYQPNLQQPIIPQQPIDPPPYIQQPLNGPIQQPLVYSVPQNAVVPNQESATLPPVPSKENKPNLCRANYDYDAQEPNELTIKAGDLIKVLSNEGDWWVGELNGKTGQFPSNYVILM